ncbi:M4 family metallopeptidase [Legionella oakridgensis]|uniref:M4 family metallopeptidase n=1 Tax=Legionella oakridgensis TaxID=29423 RepID=UPI0003DE674F|nr:M4 family metallopeptidase [Legionella oakridgensis]ETO92196.1 zinc metalloprotease [Legionella oakridgensis RV-2-2007]
MKKGIVSFLAMAVTMNGYSASQQMIWGEINHSIPNLKQKTPFTTHGLLATLNSQQQEDYQLELIDNTSPDAKHARYQLMFKGIPVWGHQLVFHSQPGSTPTVTGINTTEIEKDIASTDGKLSASEAEQKVLTNITDPIKFKKIQKVIYIDQEEKAHLAYHLTYYVNDKKTLISIPNYLIDADNGDILKQWNESRQKKAPHSKKEAHCKRIGQGLGGNAFPLPYRTGMFQYGTALPGLPSLGKFSVQVKNGNCHVQNGNVRVINLENYALGYEAFPITVFDEAGHSLNAFSYPCDETSFYLNYADGATGPVNYSFSPVNDTMFFAQQTIDMYQKAYGVETPLGTDLPIRAYTHLGEMDNAFAIPTIRVNGLLVAHQQIVIGNGDYFLTAPSQSVVAHELSHNFTELNSGLLYEGQSGGINEAFSDMAAIALQDYLRKEYPWYWDGEDWSLGREAVIGGQPLRYMDDPTQDGRSIGHASDYSDDLNVHYSSGVFNKAFYLLAHKPGWDVQSAFQVMVDANQHYWSPIAYFDFAACGVIQAAIDRQLDQTPVIEAFAEVGVVCPTHKV